MNLEEEKKGKKKMEKNETKTASGKAAKQYKVGITVEGFESLNAFLENVNRGARRKVKPTDVVSYAIAKLLPADIAPLQEKVYSAQDKLEILLEQVNAQRFANPLGRDELLISIIDSYKMKARTQRPVTPPNVRIEDDPNQRILAGVR